MNFIGRNKLTFIGIVIGAFGGYLYYHFVGCETGTCTITSQPINSTLYGAAMGGLILSSFQKDKPKSD
jgi:hypothetical protein